MSQSEIYTYQPNPIMERSFLLFRRDGTGKDEPVGDYTVLDESEDLSLSEKKLMNIVAQLNGDDQLIDLRDKTNSRLQYHRKPKLEGETKDTIVFYCYTGQGVSKENAILRLEDINNDK